jgi:hypothetical protein
MKPILSEASKAKASKPKGPPLGPTHSAHISRQQSTSGPITEVWVLGNDIGVRTRQPLTGRPRKAQSRKPRGPITAFSANSRRNCRGAIRNLRDARSFVTLTMPPDAQVDGDTLRRWWDKLREWLVTGHRTVRGGKPMVNAGSGIMVKEFTAAGIPHIHLVLDIAIPIRELARVWADVVGCHTKWFLTHGVEAKAVTDLGRLANYCGKATQKQAPAGFKVGRWWSAFGPNKPRPKLALSGPQEIMEPLTQTLWYQRAGAQPPRSRTGLIPDRFRVQNGVDQNWDLLFGLGVVHT